MGLDLRLDEKHHDGFFVVELPILQRRLAQLSKGGWENESAYIVYLALEAKGEILPYFMNEPKTAFGFIHQETLYKVVTEMFANPEMQAILQSTIERLQHDETFRHQTYSEYDSEVRPYSTIHEIDLVELLYDGHDPNVISDLMAIMNESEKAKRTVFDRLALGYLYIIGRQRDPAEFFKAEEGEAGVAKRNAQSKYTGIGLHLQERVFRALLDFGQYFEDRYKELKEIQPKLLCRIRTS